MLGRKPPRITRREPYREAHLFLARDTGRLTMMSHQDTRSELFGSDPNTPLLIHVGGGKDAGKAALRASIGTLIWRGKPGAESISEFGRDPITGEDALLDFATYEYKQDGRDREIGGSVRDARMSVAFTPGLFADHRDPDGLVRWLNDVPRQQEVLRAAGHECEMVPVVALTQQWLVDSALTTTISEAFASFDGCVGLVLASPYNPLGAAEPIRGCIEIVAGAGNVIALRSDEAAIGLLAHGALGASVGSSSTTRHLYFGRPPKKKKRRPGHEVFHLATLSWIKHYRLDVFSLPTEDLLCPCAACDGRSILRFVDPALAVDAIAHSISCLQRLAASVLEAEDPVRSWIEVCQNAAQEADRLNEIVENFDLGRSAKAWRAALQLTS